MNHIYKKTNSCGWEIVIPENRAHKVITKAGKKSPPEQYP